MRPRSAEASDVDSVVANALAAGSLRLPTPTSAHALLQAGRRSLRTGVQELDSMLRGGFPCRSLSEVCGEAGSGKTQLLLQMLVRSQMSIEEGGLARKAVYICTEGEPPITRLMQIADAHMAASPEAFERGNPLEHILVEKVHSPSELEDLLDIRLPAYLDRMPTGLIVLDSIAAPMRGDENYCDKESSASRAGLLIKMAAALKTFASRHNCAVLVANQVSDVITSDEHAKSSELSADGGERRADSQHAGAERRREGKVAAMGLAWAQAVNTRIVLSRCPHTQLRQCVLDPHLEHNTMPEEGWECFLQRSLYGLRQARVVMSPFAPTATCNYRIAASGIVSVEQQVLHTMLQGRLQ